MRLRLSRWDGTEIQAFQWSIEGLSANDMRLYLCEALLSHYDSDGTFMWPNARCRATAVPDQAELLTGRGEEILRYDVNDLIRDTGFRLRDTSAGDGMNRAIRSHRPLEATSRVCARSATGESRE
jgi:hypothetical protein